jgi:ABC-type iron transport system FetAB ATPase subunit
VLLLDEPTANLDANNTACVEDMIRKYLTRYNAIAIWVAHDSDQLKRVAQHQYQLSDGKFIKAHAV